MSIVNCQLIIGSYLCFVLKKGVPISAEIIPIEPRTGNAV